MLKSDTNILYKNDLANFLFDFIIFFKIAILCSDFSKYNIYNRLKMLYL